MTLTELQKAARDLLVLLAPVGTRMIWANESGVAPALPYISLNLINTGIKTGSTDGVVKNGANAWRIKGQRTATLSVNAYGDVAIQTALNFRDALQTEAALVFTRTKAIAIVPDGNPRDLSELEDTKIERRTQFDLSVSYTVSVDENYGPIETVEVENAITGDTITVEV